MNLTTITDIDAEIARQVSLHGEGSVTEIGREELRVAILTEEVGEIARCVCEAIKYERGGIVVAMSDHLRSALKQELVQVAAVAVAWLEALDVEP